MRRIPADGWIALALLMACGVSLNELLAAEASGAFVTSTTFPIALVVVLGLLAVALLGGSLLRGAGEVSRPDPAGTSPADLVRLAAMVAWVALYVAALPWAGYLAASAVFLVGAGLVYGNRQWGVILGVAALLPLALLLFFEKVMIVLLPASKLLG